jgi:WD40 repeat protein
VRLLKKHLPQPGESDLRGFEWRFLWQRANEDQPVSLPQQMNCNLPGLSDPLGFSKDSGTLAALDSKQTTLVLIRLATCELEQNFPLEQPAFVNPLRVAVSQDLRTFAEGLGDGRIKLWNTQARENSILKASDRRPLQLVVLSPDGRQMVTGAFQEAFRWWDLASRTNIIFKEGLERICFSGDSLKLAAFGPRKEMQLWDVPSRSLLTNLILESSVVSAVFSPDGGSLATTEPEADENPIRLHETAGGKVLGVLVGHRRAVRSIAYSADGRTLASASDDCTIKLWNVATQQELLHVHLEDGWAGNLKFSPDGTLLVASVSSAANGNSVRLFRAPKP